MMRNKLIISVILLQVIALAFMAGKREYIRAYGQTIYLRSAPIDPRDPFRGDFVRLRYSLNNVKPINMRGMLIEQRDKKGVPVYAVLKASQNGVYSLDYLTDHKPTDALFLKGYTNNNWRLRVSGTASVKYGIEQYFVQQGKGLEMEKKLGSRTKLQIPLEMKVAVGSDGTAVVMGHRWSQLGIQLEVLRVNSRNDRQAINNIEAADNTPLSPKVKVTLKNVSDQPLVLANPGDNCAFELEWVNQNIKRPTMVDKSCENVELKESDLIYLQVDEVYTTEVDFHEPRWHVNYQDKAQEVGALGAWQQFRLVYHSPAPAQLSGLKAKSPVWLGELSTAAFSNRGRVD